MFAVGVLIVAVWIGVAVLVCGIGLFTLALGAASSGSVTPCGGFAVRLNVTLLCPVVGSQLVLGLSLVCC